VLNAVKNSLRFMTRREKLGFLFFLSLRALTAIFDLAGIAAIGFLATSMALFVTQGSNPDRLIQIGSINLPAVSIESLPFITLIILGLFVFKAFASILLTHRLANFLAKIEARAARTIAQKAFGQGLETTRNNSLDEIIFAVQIGSPSAFNGLLNSVGSLVAEGFLFFIVILAFALVNPVVAIVTVLYFGAIGFLIQFFIGRLMQKTGSRIAENTVQANSNLSDLGDVIRETSILGKQSYYFNLIYNSRLKTAGNNATQFVLQGMPRYIVETALIVALALFSLYQIVEGDLASSAVTLGIFLSGGLRLTASLLPLQSALLTIKQSIPPATSAFKILYKNDERKSRDSTQQTSGAIDGPLDVSVREVDFSFRGMAINTLSGVSLEISAGKQAAFIGLSGAGKSTLADLLLGLLEPTKGEILLGNINPVDLIESQPGLLGYVPQKPGMISGTIAENIALGQPIEEIDKLRLAKAISDAHLSELVESLPEGVMTNIGKH
jgi:ABC-type multidrug transport system fused ATPase/permease subunit